MARLSVNGTERELSQYGDRSLLAALREGLGLTGAKYSCGEGVCGACTVLIDREPVRACTTQVGDVAGRSITTVEGLSHDGKLHPVQRAFLELGAMQCGFCTPGMIVSTVSLLSRNPHPNQAEARGALAGNICRCGAYARVLRAVHRAAELMRSPDGWSWDASAERVGPFSDLPRQQGPWDLTPPTERDYFTLLGDGLVVVLPPDESSWFAGGGAWIHVGAHGRITAFTGKVDVGQDNRTALSQLVARELRAPLDAVELVMGDTDVCPFDVGTFGSRSMVDAGGQLRTTAAAARELLSEMGASKTTGYGRLLSGVRRVEVASRQAQQAPSGPWLLAGEPAPRRNGALMVTGAQRYPNDLTRTALLHGRVLRPPAYGATLRTIDLSGARAMPGVTVLQEGDFVGVAAPDPETAHRALEAIRADWHLEPQPSEGDLIEYLRTHPIEVEDWEGPFQHRAGSVKKARAAAHLRLSATYTSAYIAHVPMETRAVLAEWDGGRLTVWTGTQRPFAVREEIAEALGLEERQVRVVVPDTGGGFGGKHTATMAIEAARLARATKRPVKVRWSREEEFTWAYFRPAAVIDVRSGVSADGFVTAWEFDNFNAGSPAIFPPYEIGNQRLNYQPADSPLPQGSYRALAATANTFARESHMDELAHGLGMDPLEFRLKNLRDDRLAAVVRAAADRAGWAHRARGSGHAMGLAIGMEKDGRVATCVELRVGRDRRPEILRTVTAYDCGAIVNPDNLANQVEGAAVMGLGGALFEAIHFDAGKILNPRLSQYRVPRITDVPTIEVVLIDQPDEPSAGAGETPLIAVAPAVANALFTATGVRIRSLPLLPDGVLP